MGVGGECAYVCGTCVWCRSVCRGGVMSMPVYMWRPAEILLLFTITLPHSLKTGSFTKIGARSAAWKPQWYSCLCLLGPPDSTGVHVAMPIFFFIFVLGFELGSSCFYSKSFYPLNCLPSPKNAYIFKLLESIQDPWQKLLYRNMLGIYFSRGTWDPRLLPCGFLYIWWTIFLFQNLGLLHPVRCLIFSMTDCRSLCPLTFIFPSLFHDIRSQPSKTILNGFIL